MRNYFLPVLWILILTVCSKQPEVDTSLPELLFEANPALLGTQVRFSEQGFILHPPRNWLPVDSMLFNQIRERIQSIHTDEMPLQILPIAIFLNQDNQSMLSVAEIISRSNPLSITRVMDEIEKTNQVDQSERMVKRTKFLKDGIEIEQLLVQDQLRVNFRLIFNNGDGNPVQLDYLTLKTVYPEEIKAIESSIGSITIHSD